MDFSEIDVPKALEENGVKYTLSRLRIQGCEVPASTTVTDEDLKGWPDVCLWMDEAYLVKDARKRYACGAWCKKNYGLGGYEGVLCYLYGGADLCLRVLKGVLASPMRKPGVEEAVIIRTKAATNLKAIAFLQTELAAVTGSFVYISVQPLGGGWRTLLMLSCNEAGDFIIEKNALIVCKRHDVIKKLEDLLVHNSTDAFQALFKAGPPSELKNLTICVQLQAFNAEAMTRRWWKLLEADGHGGEAFRAVMQRVATPVYRIAAEKQTFKDENVVEKMYATEAFTLNSYKRMRDDNDRTGGYKKAIEMTCKGKIVMEIGTGPFALLALFAAAAGASHVYAIEADPEAAKSAQQYINNSGYTNVTLIVGLSTAVSLPSGVRAEVVVHELIGVLTTEECVIETLNDAAERLLVLDYVSIPHKVSTMASLYPVVLGDEAPPESKCSCCKGGWNLGIGLENRSCSEVREVEAVYFDRKRLPHTSASKQTVLFESVSAVRGVGCWVVLQLLATDEIMVSSLKDSSCWPKLFVKFASPVAVRGELTFEAVVSHPMEYRFEYGGQTVIVKNRSPTELDRWLSGEREGVLVDSEDGEVRVTHVNNVSVGNLAKAAELQAGGVPIVRIQHCRHSNTLSPLHKAVLNDDTQQITALCGTDEAWAVRDGVWGLTASHFEVIMGKPPRKGVTATDTHLKGTPEEWYKLFRYSEEAADVKVVNGAREGVMGLKEFTAVTGKKYLTRNLMTRDHVLECLMRCKAEGTVGREKLHVSDENLVLSMTGVQAAKPFTKGEYICRLHGVVISTATKTDHPPTQMHPFPHPIPYALYTGEYTSLAGLLPHSDHPNCTRSMTTYKGMMCGASSRLFTTFAGPPPVAVQGGNKMSWYNQDRPGFDWGRSRSPAESPTEDYDSRIERKAVDVLEKYQYLQERLRELGEVPRSRDKLREDVLEQKRVLEVERSRLDETASGLERELEEEKRVFEEKVREHEARIHQVRAVVAHAQREKDRLLQHQQGMGFADFSTLHPTETRASKKVQSRIDTLATEVMQLSSVKSQYEDVSQNSSLEARSTYRRLIEIEEGILTTTAHAEDTVLHLWDKVAKVEGTRAVSNRKYKSLVSRLESLLKYQSDVQLAIAGQGALPSRPVALTRRLYESADVPRGFEPSFRGEVSSVVNEVVVIKGTSEPVGCTWINADLTLEAVVPNSPADSAGVRSFVGRRLLTVNNSPVASIDELAGAISTNTRLLFGFST